MAKDPSFNWKEPRPPRGTKESRRAAARRAGGGGRGAAGPWTNVATKSHRKMADVAYANAMAEAKAANLAIGREGVQLRKNMRTSLKGMHPAYMDKMAAMKRQLTGGGGLALNQLENQMLQSTGGLGFHNLPPRSVEKQLAVGSWGPGYSSSRKGLTDFIKKMGGKGGAKAMLPLLLLSLLAGGLGGMGGGDNAGIDEMLGG